MTVKTLKNQRWRCRKCTITTAYFGDGDHQLQQCRNVGELLPFSRLTDAGEHQSTVAGSVVQQRLLFPVSCVLIFTYPPVYGCRDKPSRLHCNSFHLSASTAASLSSLLEIWRKKIRGGGWQEGGTPA